MAELANLLAQVRANEIAKAEAGLAQQLALPPPADLDDETKRNLAPFIQWATTANVRYCPALPTTVGSYILAARDARIPEQQILATVAAIALLHDHQGLPSPVATTAARYALEQVLKTEPPRSWTKDEKLSWATLPPEIRAVITRRDADQCKAMRRAQNEAAELRRLLAVAAKPADNTTNEKENQMKESDWNSPKQSSEDLGRDKLRKDSSGLGYKKPVDISRKVDSNWKTNDGFAGPLDSKE
jgi:hypothetical protein